MLFCSSSRGRWRRCPPPIAAYRRVASLLNHPASMELGHQCCTACSPSPPYRWTAGFPPRYRKGQTHPHVTGMVSVLTPALNVPRGLSLLQSSPHADVKFTRSPSQESVSSGSRVAAPSADATLTDVSPLVKASAQKPELCRVSHCPSLPGNLDMASGAAQLQKHLSDPALPVLPRESGAASGFGSARAARRSADTPDGLT